VLRSRETFFGAAEAAAERRAKAAAKEAATGQSSTAESEAKLALMMEKRKHREGIAKADAEARAARLKTQVAPGAPCPTGSVRVTPHSLA
jgi:hypothetical protein